MICKRLLVVECLILLSGHAFAQDGVQEHLSHAEATSLKWKGIDVDQIIQTDGNDTQYVEEGKPVFLYNVGTGRFVIEGGSWGIEGRIFFEDFGRTFRLTKTGRIDSGINETNISQEKSSFGCNVPGVTRSANWSDCKKYCFTTIMDGANKYSAGGTARPRKWNFQRVETDPSSDTYTYYMWESMYAKNATTPVNYYLGAAWGEWHNASDKGDGTFVFLDDDRTCWTTDVVIGNTTKKEVSGSMIPIEKLYQWRLISQEEFLEVLNSQVVGINPSISCLVPDRDFTRNSEDFYEKWVVERNEATAEYGYASSDIGRSGYTAGNVAKNTKQTKRNSEPWYQPVRLKQIFDNSTLGTLEEGFKNSKYGFMSFEGVGSVHVEFEVSKPGWYRVESVAFCQSNNNDAYMYTKVKGSNGAVPADGYSQIELLRLPDGTYGPKNNSWRCLDVGKELTQNPVPYNRKIWIYVSPDGFDSNVDNRTMVIGFRKDAATKSAKVETYNSVDYYYDTDWVCIDDIKVSYMGESPVFFDEDKESLNYLDSDHILTDGASPTGRYSGAVCLKRQLKVDQWNSFSFPLPLTGEQVRYAFGEDATLAKIHSIGGLTLNAYVIDFETIDLFTTDPVVEPGKFYLLSPTVEAMEGVDFMGNECMFYNLGRMFFSVNGSAEDAEYAAEHPVMSLDDVNASAFISSYEDMNDGESFVSYVRTPDYANFAVSGGLYTGSVADGLYAVKGSYVVSNNTIYHINKDTPLKGFRGWITLTHELNTKHQQLSMSVNGRLNGEEITGVEMPMAAREELIDNAMVYDLNGRPLGRFQERADRLPKGIYIVGGKKMVINNR